MSTENSVFVRLTWFYSNEHSFQGKYHPTSYYFLRDRKADGFDTVRYNSARHVQLHLLAYLLEDPCQG